VGAQRVERRQFLYAWAAPACPQIDQQRLTRGLAQLRLAFAGIEQLRVRHRLAGVGAANALLAAFGRFDLLLLLFSGLALASAQGEGTQRSEDQDCPVAHAHADSQRPARAQPAGTRPLEPLGRSS
jgi:hypothetical protein